MWEERHKETFARPGIVEQMARWSQIERVGAEVFETGLRGSR